MTFDLMMVLLLLAAAVVMFVLGRPRMDFVALLMMTLLPLLGLVTVQEALAGLADPNIVLIAALFVLGEGLVRTGVAKAMGDFLVHRAGASRTRLIVLLMALVGAMGSVMSSTGVVAIFIPIVLRIARTTETAPSQLMMPLSMAALISGMLTLVATAPNLVVHGELIRQGHTGFAFFDFTLFGVPILICAILYMLLAQRLLPDHGENPAEGQRRPMLSDWVRDYDLQGREHRLMISPKSRLAGAALRDLDLRSAEGINIIAVERAGRFDRHVIRPEATTVLQTGDILLLDVFAPRRDLGEIARTEGLAPLPLTDEALASVRDDIGMVEVVVPSGSSLDGTTVLTGRFRSKFGLNVIGIRRGAEPIAGPIVNEPIRAGDRLLLVGNWRDIERLDQIRQTMVLMDLPVEAAEASPAADRAPLAVLSLAVAVVLMVTGIVPNVIAAFIGCLMMGAFRCIDMASAYRSINWPTLILIVGMMPFSAALQATGGIDIAAEFLVGVLGEASPRMTLTVLFVVTAGLGLFISNTATAVLMAPVSLAIADRLGASPYPFAMTVALASSAAFMTPVSSPVNTLVVGPGNYTFFDFVRIGVPFALIAMAVSVFLVPILMPLY